MHASTLRVFGERLTAREDAYRALASRVAFWSSIPGAVERLKLIDDARDIDEYRRLTRQFESDELPHLVRQWREQRQATAEAALGRVRAKAGPWTYSLGGGLIPTGSQALGADPRA